MTDKEKLEKMVAEIDRLLSIEDLGFEDGDVEHGYKNCLRDLKRFYNSMQVSPCLKCEGDGLPGTCASISELGRCSLKNQKQEPVSEDLNSFAIKYAQDKPYPVTVCQAVKVGANWQKEKDEKEKSDIYDIAVEVGRKLGETDMKLQMMKEAVDCMVCRDGIISLLQYNRPAFANILEKYKDNDKVKLIIIKED